MKAIHSNKCDWPKVTLGDICEFAYGKSLPAKNRSGDGFPVYGSNGKVGLHKDALTNGATIIIGRKGSFGEVHFSSGPCSPIDTTYYITAEQTKAFLPWLARRLRCLGLSTLNRAAAIPGLNRTDAYRQKLLLPPLAEQKRIAGILDVADALRVKRREALAQLDTLLQSTFLDMFGDPVTNPMGWEKPTIKKTNSVVQIGPFGSLLHKEDYVANGVPLINPKHIKDGVIIPGEDETVSITKVKKLSTYQLCQGDVIMGRRGEMGRCAVIDVKNEGFLCGTGSLFIRPNLSFFEPVYLFMVLSSESMRKHLEKVAWGVTMANLNRTKVEILQIPLPPLDLQRRFAAAVESVERQKARQRAHLAELDTLFAALQQRAFRGGL